MVLNKNKKILLSLFLTSLILIIFLLILIYQKGTEKLQTGLLKINDKNINVEIVTTQVQQYQGLSNRISLCSDCGMLFIFPDKEVRKFVMRNMNFPLDIIFVSDNEIINIEKNLSPEGNEPANLYQSLIPADMVLELNGTYVERNNIKVGDKIIIENRN